MSSISTVKSASNELGYLSEKAPRKADHALSMKKIYIHQIRGGSKRCEGRIFKGPVKNLMPGKTLRFYYMSNASDDVVCRITKIERFGSFANMLDSIPYDQCVPQAKSKAEALSLYMGIPGFAEKEKEFGVAAIYLELAHDWS